MKVFAENVFQSRDFSIETFYRIDIDSNNSIILGRGHYRAHHFDVKAKAYLKTSNLTVAFSNSAFLSSYNVTVKNSSYHLNTLQAQSNKTSVRFLAFYYLQIVEASSVKAHNFFFKSNLGMSIMDSRLESMLYHTCNMDSPFDNNLFYCIKKSSIDKVLNEDKFLAAFNQQY